MKASTRNTMAGAAAEYKEDVLTPNALNPSDFGI